MRNINFSFLNFCTKYKSEGDVNKNMDESACFGTIFNSRYKKPHNKYTIKIYRDYTQAHNNNCCVISEEQLIDHIERCRKIHNFTYTLKSNDDKSIYTLVLDLNAGLLYHKYILSWIRYTYEFPYNVCLYEAYKLKKVKGFMNKSIFNLFNLISASWGYSCHGTDIHAIGSFYTPKKFLDLKSTKSKLFKLNKKNYLSKVCDVVDYYNDKENPFKKIETCYEIKNNKNIVDTVYHDNELNFWTNEKAFKKRLRIYRYNKNLIKNK